MQGPWVKGITCGTESIQVCMKRKVYRTELGVFDMSSHKSAMCKNYIFKKCSDVKHAIYIYICAVKSNTVNS